jgi:hypothetical protein
LDAFTSSIILVLQEPNFSFLIIFSNMVLMDSAWIYTGVIFWFHT